MNHAIARTLLAACLVCAGGHAALAAEPDNMLDVDGYKVNMISLGSGPYTVIFESGFASDLSGWRDVAPQVAKTSRAVIYSRAGTGQSAPRPEPRTLDQASAELSHLIAAAKLSPPFILVGHSYGGFLIRNYAAQHPEQIAGMVFVDPSSETQVLELAKLDAARTAQDNAAILKIMPPNLKAEWLQLQQIFEAGALPQHGPLPNVPTVMLSSTKHYDQPEFFLQSDQGMAVWHRLHDQLFSQFSVGSHVVTPNSGHFIQRDEPALVIGAIDSVIASAKLQVTQRAHQAARATLFQAFERATATLAQDKAGAEALVNKVLAASGLGEGEINTIGYDFLGKRAQPGMAELVMKFNVASNATSANACDSYGDVLMALHRPADAKVQFQSALALAKAAGKDARQLAGFQDSLAKAEQALAKQ